jgi:tetratricopeptide (TPR) repeat protein
VRAENLEESVKLLNRARSLAPGNEHYALVLAQIYLRQENYDAAAKTVEPLAREASDPQMRSNAQAILAAIKNVREQAERYKAMREAYERGEGRPPMLATRDGGVPARTPAKTEEEIEAEAAEAVRAAMNDAMRKPLGGETRSLGVLTRIECGAKGLVFVVRVGERLLRLSARAFEDMHIMAFTSEAGGEITCGPRKPESAVVVTYRASADARAKTDGTIAALEFVPADFKLKQ